MIYTEQVCREVLRYLPAVGLGFRQIIRDCSFQEYRFPQGWNLLYGIAGTLRFSGIFEDEDKFKPERFSSQKKSFDYAYIPFGAGGVRECLGKTLALLEMKLFAAHLTGYNWQLIPGQDLTFTILPNPHPRDGLKVRFSPLD